MRRAAVVLALGWAAVAAGETRRFALVVGSNTGEGIAAGPLRYADDDAAAMQELLVEAGYEAELLTTPDADTSRLHGRSAPAGPPTLPEIVRVFESQRSAMREARTRGDDVEWLFFFSGHGDVEHGEGFLGLEQGRLTRAYLHEQLIARAPAGRIHVVIDACRSALMVLDKGPGGHRERLASALASSPGLGAQVGYVVSASATRESHEWERFQSGVFSYEVRSALRGAADANGDGRISYAELGAFLQTANLAIPSPENRPDFLVVPPGGRSGLEEPVLSWSPRAAALELNAAVGHVYVERETGERLLDVNAAGGFAAPLFLPEQRPLFLRSADESTEWQVASPAPVLAANLVGRPSSARSKGALHVAFEHLFSNPFGRPAVADWVKGWSPPDLSLVDASGASPATATVRRVGGWTLLCGSAVGASGFVVAQALGTPSPTLSGSARASRNQALSVANGVGVAGLASAAVGGALWLAFGSWGNGTPFRLAPTAAPGSLGVSWAVALP
jgi:hypothetical protein